MANAALESDPTLRELRFAMVPSQLSEDEFWRCYFWHVALVKCELCHDWTGANLLRRRAPSIYSAARAADDALLNDDEGEEDDALTPSRRQEGPSEAELDAEFDRLVGSP